MSLPCGGCWHCARCRVFLGDVDPCCLHARDFVFTAAIARFQIDADAEHHAQAQLPLSQDKSWVLIWELRELTLNGSCREAMLEGGAVSILAALLAEDDLPAAAKANAAATLKVRP